MHRNKNVQEFLMGNFEEKTSRGVLGADMMYLKEIECKGVEWFQLAQDRVH
jgi:hypothetical protein